jgi:hypothetical protein
MAAAPLATIGAHQVMHPKRRSGRIAKEVPILLLGTNSAGKVFAEQTKTVVLSRHGAGVISKYRFAPDEVLTLRLPGTGKEAEVRLVGQIGGEPGRYVHGVAFVDPNLDFWPIEFPPPEPFGAVREQITMECTLCRAQRTAAPQEIEEDVYAVNGTVLGFCQSCGTATPWIKAREEAVVVTQVQRAAEPNRGGGKVADAPAPLPACLPAASAGDRQIAKQPYRLSIPATSPQVVAKPPAQAAQPAAASAYSTSTIETLPMAAVDFNLAVEPDPEVVQAEVAETPTVAGSNTDAGKRPNDPQGRPVNRRKHMRVRVNYAACVRQGESGEDIAECENVSKGGLCFRSRREYALNSTIEVAAPYSPGAPALFVPAKIRRVQPLGDGTFFRYGVAYVESKPAAPGF